MYLSREQENRRANRSPECRWRQRNFPSSSTDSQTRDQITRLSDSSADWLEDLSSEWMVEKLLVEWKCVAQQYKGDKKYCEPQQDPPKTAQKKTDADGNLRGEGGTKNLKETQEQKTANKTSIGNPSKKRPSRPMKGTRQTTTERVKLPSSLEEQDANTGAQDDWWSMLFVRKSRENEIYIFVSRPTLAGTNPQTNIHLLKSRHRDSRGKMVQKGKQTSACSQARPTTRENKRAEAQRGKRIDAAGNEDASERNLDPQTLRTCTHSALVPDFPLDEEQLGARGENEFSMQNAGTQIPEKRAWETTTRRGRGSRRGGRREERVGSDGLLPEFGALAAAPVAHHHPLLYEKLTSRTHEPNIAPLRASPSPTLIFPPLSVVLLDSESDFCKADVDLACPRSDNAYSRLVLLPARRVHRGDEDPMPLPTPVASGKWWLAWPVLERECESDEDGSTLGETKEPGQETTQAGRGRRW
ncbi:hypothetical protein K438DRAFT_1782161 [Mycena galopus ATCC 62051]|nr:hypothetical protein K438DRAFT_1782161 [Mycena galopus ATCC 62051]